MERDILQDMAAWKEDPYRKPLILKGPRQVGKTWVMREFGRRHYQDTAYFNFDDAPELKSIFQRSKEPERIVELLGLIRGKKIDPQNTLILFDEIQECGEALNSLKYFCEDAPQYQVICAGSLLGTLLAQPKSYPVGKVNLLRVGPLSFGEFLQAMDEPLFAYYQSVTSAVPMEPIFLSRLNELLKIYLIVGGMPECVSLWKSEKDVSLVERTQDEIIALYENDFSKYSGKVNSGRILMTWRSIPTQLAKENNKFVYGCIRSGARAREFEVAIEWLVSAGLVNRVYCSKKIEYPLPVYDNLRSFKIYLPDTGLLRRMAGIEAKILILDQTPFSFLGALAENYVLQQFQSRFDPEPRFWTDDAGPAEIDFLLQNQGEILPVEVKYGENVRSKSLVYYQRKFHPKVAVRISGQNIKMDGGTLDIPLSMCGRLPEFLSELQ